MEIEGNEGEHPAAVGPEDVRAFFLDVSGVEDRERGETRDRLLADLLCIFCADILNDAEVAESWRLQILQYVRSRSN